MTTKWRQMMGLKQRCCHTWICHPRRVKLGLVFSQIIYDRRN